MTSSSVVRAGRTKWHDAHRRHRSDVGYGLRATNQGIQIPGKHTMQLLEVYGVGRSPIPRPLVEVIHKALIHIVVADDVLWLCSAAASYAVGTAMAVDGGLTVGPANVDG